MSLSGSQHKERYEQMKAEVNRRQVEWWLYRSNKQEVSTDLKSIIEMLKNEFLTVGPFGSPFVKENRNTFKPDFYGIPLQHNFVSDDSNNFEGLAYVATCGDSSILLKSVFDFLRADENTAAFEKINLTAICVQLAINHNKERMVVSVDCIENIKPMSFYEHPANGRLVMALENADPPEQTAITFQGTRRPPTTSVQDVLFKATNLYNEYELGNTEYHDLPSCLYSFFEKKNDYSV